MASRFLAPFPAGLAGRGMEPLFDLHREVNRLFDDMLGGAGGPLAAAGSPSGLMPLPRLDVRESEGELCITAELPGVKESDVDLRIDGDLLTLSGEKKNEIDRKQENYHVMERSYGSFRRTVQLPFAPNPDEVQASFEQGVLTIRMPRLAQQQRSRRIEIRHAAGAPSPMLQQAGESRPAGEGQGAAPAGPMQDGAPSAEQGGAGLHH